MPTSSGDWLILPKNSFLQPLITFGKQFDGLTLKAQTLLAQTAGLPAVTEESRRATVAIRNFKRQGTEGLIACRIRSIVHPLPGDHVIREANHFLRLLCGFDQGFTRDFH